MAALSFCRIVIRRIVPCGRRFFKRAAGNALHMNIVYLRRECGVIPPYIFLICALMKYPPASATA